MALKNKKILKITIVSIIAIILVSVVIGKVMGKLEEKRTLSEIEQHIANKEYEFAFDKINSGYISDADMENYREIVVPYMQEEFTNAKKSERDSLSLIIDGTEYFFYDGDSIVSSNDKIYTYIYTKKNDERTILYEVPERNFDIIGDTTIFWGYYLDPNQCMYANNCLFFIEERTTSDSLTGTSEYYALKYLDLDTGISGEIGSDEYFEWMYKLEDGSIFVQYAYYDMDNGGKRNPCGGIRYNPYTQTTHEGDHVVTEEEIENAIYQCR